MNRAAQASVLVPANVELKIRHVPPIGSLTSTVIGAALWFRSVTSYSTSYVLVAIFWKSICLRSQTT